MSKPRTVRVRIAVAVDSESKWYPGGGGGVSDSDAIELAIDGLSARAAITFVEADVRLPEIETVEGEVKP